MSNELCDMSRPVCRIPTINTSVRNTKHGAMKKNENKNKCSYIHNRTKVHKQGFYPIAVSSVGTQLEETMCQNEEQMFFPWPRRSAGKSNKQRISVLSPHLHIDWMTQYTKAAKNIIQYVMLLLAGTWYYVFTHTKRWLLLPAATTKHSNC